MSRLIEVLRATGKTEFSRPEIVEAAKSVNENPNQILANPLHKVRHGVYSVNEVLRITAPAVDASLNLAKASASTGEVSQLIPLKDPTYIPFGFYKDLTTILNNKTFYPVFVSGLSGNGKTTMIEQACAALKRECIRVNISIETDEDDLIGGNTLVNGNVVYREGPVSIAMKKGAVLILDEVDRGSNKLMCLQAILEGKPYFNKKTGETIVPAEGFNIVATANTKGQGAEDGRYMAAQILDDAFLERFAITVEQEYPSSKVEKRIIMKKMQRVNKVDEDFADKLVAWAEIIRKTFLEGGVDELISTRRLEHIVNAYAMFNNRRKAINLCVARFNQETKESFLDLYTKVDDESTAQAAAQAPEVNEEE